MAGTLLNASDVRKRLYDALEKISGSSPRNVAKGIEELNTVLKNEKHCHALRLQNAELVSSVSKQNAVGTVRYSDFAFALEKLVQCCRKFLRGLGRKASTVLSAKLSKVKDLVLLISVTAEQSHGGWGIRDSRVVGDACRLLVSLLESNDKGLLPDCTRALNALLKPFCDYIDLVLSAGQIESLWKVSKLHLNKCYLQPHIRCGDGIDLVPPRLLLELMQNIFSWINFDVPEELLTDAFACIVSWLDPKAVGRRPRVGIENRYLFASCDIVVLKLYTTMLESHGASLYPLIVSTECLNMTALLRFVAYLHDSGGPAFVRPLQLTAAYAVQKEIRVFLDRASQLGARNDSGVYFPGGKAFLDKVFFLFFGQSAIYPMISEQYSAAKAIRSDSSFIREGIPKKISVDLSYHYLALGADLIHCGILLKESLSGVPSIDDILRSLESSSSGDAIFWLQLLHTLLRQHPFGSFHPLSNLEGFLNILIVVENTIRKSFETGFIETPTLVNNLKKKTPRKYTSTSSACFWALKCLLPLSWSCGCTVRELRPSQVSTDGKNELDSTVIRIKTKCGDIWRFILSRILPNIADMSLFRGCIRALYSLLKAGLIHSEYVTSTFPEIWNLSKALEPYSPSISENFAGLFQSDHLDEHSHKALSKIPVGSLGNSEVLSETFHDSWKHGKPFPQNNDDLIDAESSSTRSFSRKVDSLPLVEIEFMILVLQTTRRCEDYFSVLFEKPGTGVSLKSKTKTKLSNLSASVSERELQCKKLQCHQGTVDSSSLNGDMGWDISTAEESLLQASTKEGCSVEQSYISANSDNPRAMTLRWIFRWLVCVLNDENCLSDYAELSLKVSLESISTLVVALAQPGVFHDDSDRQVCVNNVFDVDTNTQQPADFMSVGALKPLPCLDSVFSKTQKKERCKLTSRSKLDQAMLSLIDQMFQKLFDRIEINRSNMLPEALTALKTLYVLDRVTIGLELSIDNLTRNWKKLAKEVFEFIPKVLQTTSQRSFFLLIEGLLHGKIFSEVNSMDAIEQVFSYLKRLVCQGGAVSEVRSLNMTASEALYYEDLTTKSKSKEDLLAVDKPLAFSKRRRIGTPDSFAVDNDELSKGRYTNSDGLVNNFDAPDSDSDSSNFSFSGAGSSDDNQTVSCHLTDKKSVLPLVSENPPCSGDVDKLDDGSAYSLVSSVLLADQSDAANILSISLDFILSSAKDESSEKALSPVKYLINMCQRQFNKGDYGSLNIICCLVLAVSRFCRKVIRNTIRLPFNRSKDMVVACVELLIETLHQSMSALGQFVRERILFSLHEVLIQLPKIQGIVGNWDNFKKIHSEVSVEPISELGRIATFTCLEAIWGLMSNRDDHSQYLWLTQCFSSRGNKHALNIVFIAGRYLEMHHDAWPDYQRAQAIINQIAKNIVNFMSVGIEPKSMHLKEPAKVNVAANASCARLIYFRNFFAERVEMVANASIESDFYSSDTSLSFLNLDLRKDSIMCNLSERRVTRHDTLANYEQNLGQDSVLLRWKFLRNLACARKRFLAPVIFCLCRLAASESMRMSNRTADCLFSSRIRAFLHSSIESLRRAHNFKSLCSLFYAYCHFLCHHWLEPQVINSFRESCCVAEGDVNGNETNRIESIVESFPYFLFQFSTFESFKEISLVSWVTSLRLHGLISKNWKQLRLFSNLSDAQIQALDCGVHGICDPIRNRFTGISDCFNSKCAVVEYGLGTCDEFIQSKLCQSLEIITCGGCRLEKRVVLETPWNNLSIEQLTAWLDEDNEVLKCLCSPNGELIFVNVVHWLGLSMEHLPRGQDTNLLLTILRHLISKWLVYKALGFVAVDVSVHLILRTLVHDRRHICLALSCLRTLLLATEAKGNAIMSTCADVAAFTLLRLQKKITKPGNDGDKHCYSCGDEFSKHAGETIQQLAINFFQALDPESPMGRLLMAYFDLKLKTDCKISTYQINDVLEDPVSIFLGLYGSKESSYLMKLVDDPGLYEPICAASLELLVALLSSRDLQSLLGTYSRRKLTKVVWVSLRLLGIEVDDHFLAQFDRQHQVSRIHELASRCIGLIGLLGTRAADPTPYDLDLAIGEADGLEKVIMHLANALSGRNSGIAQCSGQFLRSLLCEKDSIEALRHLPSRLKSTCQLFQIASMTSRENANALGFFSNRLLGVSILSRIQYLRDLVLGTHPETSILTLDSQKRIWRSCIPLKGAKGVPFPDWICFLTYQISSYIISSEDIFNGCSRLCALDSSFAIAVFPLLVREMSRKNSLCCIDSGSLSAVDFLASELAYLLGDCAIDVDSRILRLILNSLTYFRRIYVQEYLFQGKKESSHHARGRLPVADPLVMRLDLLQVAKAALRCGMHSAAVFYCELWYHESDICITDDISKGSDAQKLLLEAYRRIGTSELLHGMGSQILLEDSVKADVLNSDWESALIGIDGLLHENSVSHAAFRDVNQIMPAALKNAGLHYLFRTFSSASTNRSCNIRNSSSSSANFKPAFPSSLDASCVAGYEVAWRYLRPARGDDHCFLIHDSFDYIFYRALASLVDGNYASLRDVCLSAYCYAANILRTRLLSQELGSEIYSLIGNLQQLHEIETIWKLRWESDRSTSFDDSIETVLLRGWNRDMTKRSLRFEEAEPVLQLRRSMLAVLGAPEFIPAESCDFQFQGILMLNKHLEFMSRFARDCNKPKLARNYLNSISRVSSPTRDGLLEERNILFETASVLWANGSAEEAIRLLQTVIGMLTSEEENEPFQIRKKKIRVSESKLLLANALCKVGYWLADTGGELYSSIVDDYLKKAVEYNEGFIRSEVFFSGVDSIAMEQLVQSREKLASFVDKEYRKMLSRLESPEWQRRCAIEKKIMADLSEARLMEPAHDPDVQRGRDKLVQKLETTVQEYRQERELYEMQLQPLLLTTIDAYSKALGTDGGTPIAFVFRFVSLWFDNSLDCTVNKRMEANLTNGTIPPHKLLPLVHQIASRVGSDVELSFDRAVSNSLHFLGTHHPFHVIPTLFAMANGNNLPKRLANRRFAAFNEPRIVEARRIVDELGACDPRVLAMEDVLNAITKLAYHRVRNTVVHQNGKNRAKRVSRVNRLTATADCEGFNCRMEAYKQRGILIPVPVACVPVRPTGDYTSRPEELHFLQDFDSHFSLNTSGATRPKVLSAYTSSGQKTRMLVKGLNDDMRQDAVLQQLFSLVDQVLAQDQCTSKSKLGIRTYKVVPLTPAAGVVQWIEDTHQLMDYLSRAHNRYRNDDDLSVQAAASLMKENVEKCSSLSDMLKGFRNICSRFRPVMRHFFLERFSSPLAWYTKRVAYARSVGVNSMVGYIVGLGDRHLGNFLVDSNTAEIISIDFGICFERGRKLRIPERVPFRLTRDIVDGFGPAGVNGSFVAACEDTMTVLRANADAFLTICKVFLHDPLYSWTVSPLTLHKDESANLLDEPQPDVNIDEQRVAEKENVTAEYVLLRVALKLQGRSEATSENLSVNSQVRSLINEARSEVNLCTMYHGWGAHM